LDDSFDDNNEEDIEEDENEEKMESDVNEIEKYLKGANNDMINDLKKSLSVNDWKQMF
jgi:hypothetical protein